MTDINELEITWEKVSWTVDTRIGTDMAEIISWGELRYLSTTEYPKVLVEFDDKACKIQIYDIKVYTGTTFPTDNMKKCIASSLIKNHEVYGDKYTYLLLDANYQLFGGRTDFRKPWEYLGIETDKWKPLNFTSFCDWFDKYGNELSGQDFFWRIGNQLFRTPNMYSERILGTIVLADYCDKFIPKRDGEVKPVSFWGFSTLVMFLRNIIGDKRTITTSQLRSLYKDFDTSNCIPVIPTRWKTTDIELMNTRRLDLILTELEESKLREEEEKVKKLNKNREEDSENNLEKDSAGTSSISKLLKDAKELVQKQISLAKSDTTANIVYGKNKQVNLSDIISGQLLLSSKIWSEEYLVDIDTNITEGGISIGENEMLVAIISFGFLEILVEDNVQKALCKELADNVEEKYGIAVQFYRLSDENGKDILKRGEEINAKY